MYVKLVNRLKKIYFNTLWILQFLLSIDAVSHYLTIFGIRGFKKDPTVHIIAVIAVINQLPK